MKEAELDIHCIEPTTWLTGITAWLSESITSNTKEHVSGRQTLNQDIINFLIPSKNFNRNVVFKHLIQGSV